MTWSFDCRGENFGALCGYSNLCRTYSSDFLLSWQAYSWVRMDGIV